jgi:hypothetical protein
MPLEASTQPHIKNGYGDPAPWPMASHVLVPASSACHLVVLTALAVRRLLEDPAALVLSDDRVNVLQSA